MARAVVPLRFVLPTLPAHQLQRAQRRGEHPVIRVRVGHSPGQLLDLVPRRFALCGLLLDPVQARSPKPHSGASRWPQADQNLRTVELALRQLNVGGADSELWDVERCRRLMDDWAAAIETR